MENFDLRELIKSNSSFADLATGCINRLCVTDDIEEFDILLSSLIVYSVHIRDNRLKILSLKNNEFKGGEK